MCAVHLTRHGGPEVLQWRDDIKVPLPGPGQVLTRVLAAGVNNTDINTRIGWYAKEIREATEVIDADIEIEAGGWGGALIFPRIQGADLCGEVVALGQGVEGLPLGARVTTPVNQPIPTQDEPIKFRCIGSELDGAFAQYCLIDADQTHDVSASPLTDIEIAAMPCAFGTAEGLLARADVALTDNVLVTGASGGVGLAAVQLAKLRGAKVTGIASTAKQQAVRDAGADHVLDRGETAPAQTFDVAIDLVGGPAWDGLIDGLKPGGRYAVAGAIAGPIVEADLRTIYLNDLTIYGCTYQSREVFARLVELINAGKVRPLVSKTYPLADITVAQEDFQSKRFAGKLVLIPPEVK